MKFYFIFLPHPIRIIFYPGKSFCGPERIFFRVVVVFTEMGASSAEKKSKSASTGSAATGKMDTGDRIEPESAVVPLDTSKWPLLLKVCQHFPVTSDAF